MLFFIWVQYIHGFRIQSIYTTFFPTHLTILKYFTFFNPKWCKLIVINFSQFTIIWSRRGDVLLSFLWNFNHCDVISFWYARPNVLLDVCLRVTVINLNFSLFICFYIRTLLHIFLFWIQTFNDLRLEYVTSSTKVFTESVSTVSKCFTSTETLLCDLVTTDVKPYVIWTMRSL